MFFEGSMVGFYQMMNVQLGIQASMLEIILLSSLVFGSAPGVSLFASVWVLS